MVRNGQAVVTALPYRPSVGAPPGVEVLAFSDLVARAAGHGVDPYGPRRPEFHELIVVRSGTLRCSLDFTEHELRPGIWLWAQPGQVHRYTSELGAAEGRIVLFVPNFLSAATAEAARVDRGTWQPTSTPGDIDRDTLDQVLDLLEREQARWDDQPSEAQLEVLRHLLAVLVVRLADLHGAARRSNNGDAAFARFQAAVEQDFTRSHRVEDYAGRLGYSVRTLTRATQAAVGRSAKGFIDDRLLLEAKRLLAHTDLPVASIGQRLGFPGATVFTKFFRQHSGQTPTAFRAHAAATRATGSPKLLRPHP